MIIVYEANGMTISDFEINEFVDQCQYGKTYRVSNFQVMEEIRVRISEKKLDYNKIKFKFDGNIINIDSDANTDKDYSGDSGGLTQRLLKIFNNY